MDKNYVITKVSPKVDSWSSQYGEMKTYYVQLDGFDGPVQINQKPTTPEPEEGQELFGHVESNQHGHKFKKAQNPNYSGAPRGSVKHEKNEDGMAWGNALNVAVIALKSDINVEDLVSYAKELFEARPGAQQTQLPVETDAGRKALAEGLEKMASQVQAKNTKDDSDPGPSDEDYQEEGEIDLQDIPF